MSVATKFGTSITCALEDNTKTLKKILLFNPVALNAF